MNYVFNIIGLSLICSFGRIISTKFCAAKGHSKNILNVISSRLLCSVAKLFLLGRLFSLISPPQSGTYVIVSVNKFSLAQALPSARPLVELLGRGRPSTLVLFIGRPSLYAVLLPAELVAPPHNAGLGPVS